MESVLPSALLECRYLSKYLGQAATRTVQSPALPTWHLQHPTAGTAGARWGWPYLCWPNRQVATPRLTTDTSGQRSICAVRSDRRRTERKCYTSQPAFRVGEQHRPITVQG